MKSNVAMFREGLRMLEEVSGREALREEFRKAFLATRQSLHEELDALEQRAAGHQEIGKAKNVGGRLSRRPVCHPLPIFTTLPANLQ